MSSIGRPRKVPGVLQDTAVTFKISQEARAAIVQSAVDNRCSIAEWLRIACLKRLEALGVNIDGIDENTGLQRKSISSTTIRKGQLRVDLLEITSLKMWEPARTFFNMYIYVCLRHPKLEETLTYNRMFKGEKDKRAIMLKRASALKVLELIRTEPAFDGNMILEALDTLPWYNGDNPEATWGVADIDWLVTKKKSKEDPNWERLQKAWRKENEKKTTIPTLKNTPQSRAIVIQVAEKCGFVEGSTDWSRLTDFVNESISKFGVEVVRQKASQVEQGPFAYQELTNLLR